MHVCVCVCVCCGFVSVQWMTMPQLSWVGPGSRVAPQQGAKEQGPVTRAHMRPHLPQLLPQLLLPQSLPRSLRQIRQIRCQVRHFVPLNLRCMQLNGMLPALLPRPDTCPWYFTVLDCPWRVCAWQRSALVACKAQPERVHSFLQSPCLLQLYIAQPCVCVCVCVCGVCRR